MPRVLIVDDEQAFVDSVVRMLRMEGHLDAVPVTNPREALERLDRGEHFDLALLDITMPEVDGLELLRRIKETSPQTECLMITAHESIPMVVKAIRLGAYDYLVKPILPDQLSQAIDRALERKTLLEALRLRAEGAAGRALRDPEAFADFVTADEAMLRILHEAELHAQSDLPILITGETGAGKEVLARAIHRASRRRAGPFVAVNMLSLSPSLFESEFFGHARGAFTGAERERAGYLAKARGGTLFLDEIGDLPMEIQGKLLRVLQEREYTPVGKTKPERAEVRFVAATNQDLDRAVQQRRFRKDLFYRLQFAKLDLPPLRHRRDDIPLLAARLLEGAPRAGVRLSEEALAALESHDWPGNVRELRGLVEAAANLAEGGVIEPEHLKLKPRRSRRAGQDGPPGTELLPLAEVERRHILSVYEAVGLNKSRAARTLEIGLQTLQRKLKAYDAR